MIGTDTATFSVLLGYVCYGHLYDSTRQEGMIGTGMATVRMPETAHATPMSRPRVPAGTSSPYPTVVMVTIAHQNASGMLWIVEPSTSSSA